MSDHFGTSVEGRDFDLQILDALADLVIVKAPGSRIVWANKAMQTFYAMTLAELRSIKEPAYAKDDLRVFETGKVLDIPEELVTRYDGKSQCFHTIKVPLFDPHGKVAFVVVVCRDITEAKKTESRLQMATRMASIGTLAAGVGHEVNNPLTYAMAHMEHMSEVLARGTPSAETLAEFKELVAEAREGMERVRQIVRGLKMFSRDDEDVRERVDIDRIVAWAAKFAANQVRARARLEIDCAASTAVDANESQLGQVILNLLVNAAQAIPEGDAEKNEVRVSTRILPSDQICIQVEDTGRGIPEENIGRLFEPFFTTKPVGEGTGLGLSIVHNIIAAHNGKIEVESKVGVGTTFRVLLPRSAAPASRRKRTSTPAVPRGRRARIMVIDDEPAILNVMRKILATEHDVSVEDNPARVIAAYARGERFDLVLCDLVMPTLTGMDLFEELKRIAPGEERRIVFVTGGVFTEDARHFVDHVENPVVEKPLRAATLLNLARAAAGTEEEPPKVLTRSDGWGGR